MTSNLTRRITTFVVTMPLVGGALVTGIHAIVHINAWIMGIPCP